MADDGAHADLSVRRADALLRIARVITGEADAPQIRAAMAEVIGEALDVDRSLIYDIRFGDEVAEGLCEWLNTQGAPIEPTLATYPLDVFRGGAEHVRDTRTWLQSHQDERHAALQRDGSAEVLHGAMSIASLLWFPFDFEEDRFFVLVFNQVRAKRVWSDADMAFVADVAELVSLAHLRLRLGEERRARAEAKERTDRLEALGLLAGGVAHDFNNLLTGVLGNIDIIRWKQPQDAAGRGELDSIERSALAATAMCKRLLTFSGRTPPTKVLDLSQILQQSVDLLPPSESRAHIVGDLQPVLTRGDPSALQQVVLNLLRNGLDALEGGGEVVVSSGIMRRSQASEELTVSLSSWGPEDRPFFVVKDSGRGMDDATRARLFEPFFSTRGSGRGLGMATVHRVLESHGALIDVRSEIGAGTTITVVLPSSQSRSTVEKGGPLPGDRPRGCSLLVVDDEVTVRRICRSALTLAGHRVMTASSAEEGLKLCRESDPPFDLVVMDVHLPGMSGPSALVELRTAGCAVPVLLMSSYLLGESAVDETHAPWSYLQKPFRPVELLERVTKLCANVEPSAG